MDSKSQTKTPAANAQSYSRFVFIQFITEQLYLILIYVPWILIIKTVDLVLPAKLKSLEGEIVLVTGGANGIGRAYCHELVRRETQLTIIIWDIDEMKAQETVKELKELGVYKAIYFIVDVSNRHRVTEVANLMRKEIGDVTMLINNAGIAGQIGEAWRMDPEIVEKVFSVNFMSHFYTMREFLPAMVQSGKGHLVETCSMAAVMWAGHGGPYFASKHALRSYIDCVKEDIRLLPTKPNIHVTVIYPEVTLTKMQDDFNVRSKKYPFLVANQTAEFVARKAIQGVLQNKETIFVPGWERIVPLMLALYPIEFVQKWLDFSELEKNRSF